MTTNNKLWHNKAMDVDSEVAKIKTLIELDPYAIWYDGDLSWTEGVQAAGVDILPTDTKE